MNALTDADYTGIVTILGAMGVFVGACAAAYIKVVKELYELKAQNVHITAQMNGRLDQLVEAKTDAARNAVLDEVRSLDPLNNHLKGP